jgi:hypothetical protein
MPVRERFDYLFEAERKVSEALTIEAAGIRERSVRDRYLVDAGKSACEALTQFVSDKAYWQEVEARVKEWDEGFLERIFCSFFRNEQRFDAVVLPVCGTLLEKLGYKPPGNGYALAERARATCASLNNYRGERLGEDTHKIWEELRQATCDVATKSYKQFSYGRILKGMRKKLIQTTAGAAVAITTLIGKEVIKSPEVKEFLDKREHQLIQSWERGEHVAGEIIFAELSRAEALLGIKAASEPEEDED